VVNSSSGFASTLGNHQVDGGGDVYRGRCPHLWNNHRIRDVLPRGARVLRTDLREVSVGAESRQGGDMKCTVCVAYQQASEQGGIWDIGSGPWAKSNSVQNEFLFRSFCGFYSSCEWGIVEPVQRHATN
jgi:hypothetical protein